MMASQLFIFLHLLPISVSGELQLLSLNSLLDSGQGGTAESWSSFVPKIALGGKIPANAKHSKDGETPLLPEIAI